MTKYSRRQHTEQCGIWCFVVLYLRLVCFGEIFAATVDVLLYHATVVPLYCSSAISWVTAVSVQSYPSFLWKGGANSCGRDRHVIIQFTPIIW